MGMWLTRNKARLTLLATLVASSSLVAAPVHAAKSPPVFTDAELSCGEGDGHYIATFDVESKGKWVYLTLVVKVADGDEFADWTAEKMDRTETIVWDENYGDQSPVTIVSATLVDRKGEPFDAANTTTGPLGPEPC